MLCRQSPLGKFGWNFVRKGERKEGREREKEEEREERQGIKGKGEEENVTF